MKYKFIFDNKTYIVNVDADTNWEGTQDFNYFWFETLSGDEITGNLHEQLNSHWEELWSNVCYREHYGLALPKEIEKLK
jgi:hypothetical protein